MIMNPNLATRLAREHQRQMLAQARQQRYPHRRPAPPTPNAAARIFRCLAAAIPSAGSAAARRHLAGSPASARRTNPSPARD
jgi:hypothetical protein